MENKLINLDNNKISNMILLVISNFPSLHPPMTLPPSGTKYLEFPFYLTIS